MKPTYFMLIMLLLFLACDRAGTRNTYAGTIWEGEMEYPDRRSTMPFCIVFNADGTLTWCEYDLEKRGKYEPTGPRSTIRIMMEDSLVHAARLDDDSLLTLSYDGYRAGASISRCRLIGRTSTLYKMECTLWSGFYDFDMTVRGSPWSKHYEGNSFRPFQLVLRSSEDENSLLSGRADVKSCDSILTDVYWYRKDAALYIRSDTATLFFGIIDFNSLKIRGVDKDRSLLHLELSKTPGLFGFRCKE